MLRDIEKELEKWKNDPDRTPLIVRGARQIGKSYTIEKFGKEYFDSVCLIDLELNSELINCFDSLNPKEIISLLELKLNQEIIPGKSLLFIDEIQTSPNALKSLRYFKEKLPDLHVIAAGSLLEFSLDDESFSFPVGRVQFMYMKPFSFTEFLRANKYDKWIEVLNTISITNPLNPTLHEDLLNLITRFFIIGGMPKVIDSYLKNKSLLKCSRLQEAIITAYLEDFGKYSKATEHYYLKVLFEKAPEFISKHVKYAKIDTTTKRPDEVFKKALNLLTKAGILHQVFATAGSGLPLRAQKNEKKFKLLFLDIGLLQSAMGVDATALSPENLSLINDGALAEQFVGQEILATQDPYLNRKLYFWQRDKPSSSAEVDYLFGYHGKVVPIEVKAGKTGRLRSIQQFISEKKTSIGIRICEKPLSLEKNILTVPFYMIHQIPRLLKEL